jgi:hypothetical protein
VLRPKQLSLLDDARLVAKITGKGFARQALEIAKFKARNPGLGATDYYVYRLYDPDYIAKSRVEDFVGWREAGEIPLVLNVRTTVTPAWDKFTLAMFGRYFDLPVPRLVAVYRPGPKPVEEIVDVGMNSPEALTNWLRTQKRWPLFVKPAYGGMGVNCHHIVGYSAATDALVMKDATEMPVERFISTVIEDKRRFYYYRHEMGYLFQEVLRSHPAIRELTGTDAISGLRLIVIQDKQGPELLTCEFKIVTGSNVIDNQRHWTTGNISGEIDPVSGRLCRVLEGDWPRAKAFDTIPGTLREFKGFVVPHWDEAVALCKRAASVFPLMRIQHWDIAITDRGPIILEVNDMGSIEGEQQWGRGILTPRFRQMLRDHGDPDKYRLVKRIVRDQAA